MFDLIDVLRFLRARWVIPAVTCGVALGLALIVTMMLPRQYTATAEVLIGAPAGNDPRAAAAVSSTYLESLKAYERLASSDTLFLRAIEHVHPQGAEAVRSIEALKKRVLRVTKPTNTAILEISVTMTDPKSAQAMAQYIAEQTAELSRSMDMQSQKDLTREFRVQLDAATARLADVRKAREAMSRSEPVEGMESTLQNASDLKLKVQTVLSAARADLAGVLAEGADGPEVASAKARVTALEKQESALTAELTVTASQLERWKAHRTSLDADQEAAQMAWETASARMNEVLSSIQFRGDRLQVMDPGIVPQNPSSPNLLFNLIAALALSLAASFVYLMVAFSFERSADREARKEPLKETTRVYSLGR